MTDFVKQLLWHAQHLYHLIHDNAEVVSTDDLRLRNIQFVGFEEKTIQFLFIVINISITTMTSLSVIFSSVTET